MKISKNQKGNTLIEAAFILPILILLLFGIVQFSFALIAKLTLTHAAYEGARIGALTNNEEKIKQKILQIIEPIDQEKQRTRISILPFRHQRGQDIALTLEYACPLFIPFFNQKEIKLKSYAVSRSECSQQECHLND
jgi:hypothetical protein